MGKFYSDRAQYLRTRSNRHIQNSPQLLGMLQKNEHMNKFYVIGLR